MAGSALFSILNVGTFAHGDWRIVKRDVYIYVRFSCIGPAKGTFDALFDRLFAIESYSKCACAACECTARAARHAGTEPSQR